ncbi:hypothetical protein BLOT_004132 [Blomia tropicalis]|nr:hypothetical protein BLOT_004132 [Blomia tropicalis]
MSDNGTNFVPIKQAIETKKCRSRYDVLVRFQEAESIINSRPVVFSDRPISAHELVFGRPLTLSAQSVHNESQHVNLYRLSKHYESLRNRFRKLIQKRYFELEKTSTNIKEGDYVLVPDSSARNNWPGGLVTSLITGRDGIARSAFIRFNGATLQRPLRGLIPIWRPECDETYTQHREETSSMDEAA